jgi:hypothetical protein
MNGYHVFYQSKEVDNEFEEINYLVQIASILFWKKNQGKMSLYCNSKYLNFIKKWGIDSLYDEINTECLDKIPYKQYLDKYWSFCKIEAAFDISKSDKDFVIIDTDLWIQEPINIDSDFQFIGYHQEKCLNHPNNPYIEPNNFINLRDLKLFDWSISPINCAFLYLNSKDLINEWYKWSLKVIENNKDNNKKEMSVDTIFVEQRLLPTIAHTLGMNVGTLIPNVYQPHIKSDNLGSEWIPKIGFDITNQYMSWNIKHVWGLKKMYDDPNIRSIIIDTVTGSLNTYFKDWEINFTELLKKIKEY